MVFDAECKRVAETQTPFRLEYRVLHRDGNYLYFQDDGYPLSDPRGTMTSVVGFRVDLTARKLAEEKIRGMNVELEKRVRERTAALEDANNELQAFCYSVSHDLRSPLRSVTGFCHALLEEYGEKLDTNARHYMERACDGALRMGHLIDDLLRLSQISRAELRLENIDMTSLARNLLAACQSQDPEREVKVRVAAKLRLRGDGRLIQIALENLLANAWKFTGKKSNALIEVGAREEKGSTVFFIRDNGDGFSMAHVNQLFGVFQRLHSADDFPGTGIGLAIVNRIIQRHGGCLWAEATRGQGATFFFTVPS